MQNNQTAAVLHVSQVEEEASRHFLLTKCDLKLNSRASFLHCDSKTHLLLSCCSTKFTMKQEALQTPGNIRLLSLALLWTSWRTTRSQKRTQVPPEAKACNCLTLCSIRSQSSLFYVCAPNLYGCSRKTTVPEVFFLLPVVLWMKGLFIISTVKTEWFTPMQSVWRRTGCTIETGSFSRRTETGFYTKKKNCSEKCVMIR